VKTETFNKQEKAVLQGRLFGAINLPVVTGAQCEEPIAGFIPAQNGDSSKMKLTLFQIQEKTQH